MIHIANDTSTGNTQITTLIYKPLTNLASSNRPVSIIKPLIEINVSLPQFLNIPLAK